MKWNPGYGLPTFTQATKTRTKWCPIDHSSSLKIILFINTLLCPYSTYQLIYIKPCFPQCDGEWRYGWSVLHYILVVAWVQRSETRGTVCRPSPRLQNKEKMMSQWQLVILKDNFVYQHIALSLLNEYQPIDIKPCFPQCDGGWRSGWSSCTTSLS